MGRAYNYAGKYLVSDKPMLQKGYRFKLSLHFMSNCQNFKIVAEQSVVQLFFFLFLFFLRLEKNVYYLTFHAVR